MPRADHRQLDPYFRTNASGIATEEECHYRKWRGLFDQHICAGEQGSPSPDSQSLRASCRRL